MKTRILTAAVMLAVFVPILWFSHLPVLYPAAMALLAAFAVFELLRCMGCRQDLWLLVPALAVAATLVFLYPLLSCPMKDYLAVMLMVFFLFTLYLFALAVFRPGKLTYGAMMGVAGGTLYITVAFAAMVLLRQFEAVGQYLFLLPFIGSWVCDTFAYFTGRLIGKHKLAPIISPKKTVEGSIGGVAFAVLAFFLFGLILAKVDGAISPNYPALLLCGLLVSLVSQIGDLALSAIKREYGIKDYSRLFPGHGGVLDRFDSVIATAPLILFFALFGGSFNLFL